ncbi:hypothetical protein FO519_008056 [Halicephalobus sp. NKZ332]|nr:hypothetical protein FO519_008056 [Halicephalobus sp. NKZ332]
MCCNNELENVMNGAYDELKAARGGWQSCNIQQIANKIQLATEQRFNTSFEALAGVGDYASKSHFYHNYVCKIERDNRIILAYASPRKDRLPQDGYLQGASQTGFNPPPAPRPGPSYNAQGPPPTSDYGAQPPAPSYGPQAPSPYKHYTYSWRGPKN